MVDYVLAAASNGGHSYAEDGGGLLFNSSIAPANLAAVTALAASNLILAGVSGVPKSITLQNLVANINVGWLATGLAGQGTIADALHSSNVPLKDTAATISGAWIFSNAAVSFRNTTGVAFDTYIDSNSATALQSWIVQAKNASSAQKDFTKLAATVVDRAAGTESGALAFYVNTKGAGLSTPVLSLYGKVTQTCPFVGINKAVPTAVLDVTVDAASDALARLTGQDGLVTAFTMTNADATWAMGMSDTNIGYWTLARNEAVSTVAIKVNPSAPYDATFAGRVISDTGLETGAVFSLIPTTIVASAGTILSASEIKHPLINLAPTTDIIMNATAYLPDGRNGQILILFNSTVNDITLSAGSTYNNDFGADVFLAPSSSVVLHFNSGTGFWHLLSAAAIGSGDLSLASAGKLYFGSVGAGNYIQFSSGAFRFYKSGVETDSI